MWYKTAKESHLDPLYDDDLPRIAVAEIEDILTKEPFDIEEFKDNDAPRMEGGRSVPIMSVAFQRFIVDRGTIPTPSEFIEKYQDTNEQFFSKLSDDQLPGTLYRAVRSYPSLTRDIHFVQMTRELGAEAARTLRDDLKGIDATIVTPDGERFIRLYFDTPRSRKHRMSKAMVHPISEKHIDVPLMNDEATKVGNVYLYSERCIQELLSDMGVINGFTEAEQ